MLTKKTAIIGKEYGKPGFIVAKGMESFPATAHLNQYGNCNSCNTALMSWSKLATCPKCRIIVSLT